MNSKILFVASTPEHIKAFHLPYLEWFQENGYETHIAVNGEMDLPYVDKIHQVDFQRNPFKKDNIKAYKQLKHILDTENFVLVNCHTPVASVLTRLAAGQARKKGTKIIYTAHGFHFYDGASLKNWLLFYPVEKWLTQYTDALITINTEDFERIKKVGDKKCQYFLVNGIGVNKEKFFPISKEEKLGLRKEFNLKNEIIFIYAARIAKEKGHKFAMKVIAKNKDLFSGMRFLFAGNWEESEEEYRQMLKDLNISEIVEFLGFRSDIDRLFKMGDYCFSPSEREGLPINIVEAMFSGLPIIATENRGHKELVNNGINGFLFGINQEKEFVEIIKKIKNKTFDYEQMSAESLEKAQKFGIKNSLKAITDIYQKVLRNE